MSVFVSAVFSVKRFLLLKKESEESMVGQTEAFIYP